MFEQVGSSFDSGTIGITRTQSPQVSNVTVVNEQGISVDVRSTGGFTQTLEINGTNYEGVATFDIPTEGTWTINVEASGPSEVRIAPSLTQNIALFIVMILLAIAGSLLTLIRVIVVAIAWARRSNDESNNPEPPTPSAGAPPTLHQPNVAPAPSAATPWTPPLAAPAPPPPPT